MVKVAHPFYRTCQDVLKEMYPGQKPVVAGSSPLAAYGIPEDVAAEAIKRLYGGKKQFRIPSFRVKHVN